MLINNKRRVKLVSFGSIPIGRFFMHAGNLYQKIDINESPTHISRGVNTLNWPDFTFCNFLPKTEVEPRTVIEITTVEHD